MDYEYEQDRHLRTLANQARAAEGEALSAVQALVKCQRRLRLMIILNLFGVASATALGVLVLGV